MCAALQAYGCEILLSGAAGTVCGETVHPDSPGHMSQLILQKKNNITSIYSDAPSRREYVIVHAYMHNVHNVEARNSMKRHSELENSGAVSSFWFCDDQLQ